MFLLFTHDVAQSGGAYGCVYLAFVNAINTVNFGYFYVFFGTTTMKQNSVFYTISQSVGFEWVNGWCQSYLVLRHTFPFGAEVQEYSGNDCLSAVKSCHSYPTDLLSVTWPAECLWGDITVSIVLNLQCFELFIVVISITCDPSSRVPVVSSSKCFSRLFQHMRTTGLTSCSLICDLLRVISELGEYLNDTYCMCTLTNGILNLKHVLKRTPLNRRACQQLDRMVNIVH